MDKLVLQHDLAFRWLESGARDHVGLLTGLFEVQSGDWRTFVKIAEGLPNGRRLEEARVPICGSASPNLILPLLPDGPGQYASAFGLQHGLGVDAHKQVQEWGD